MAYKDIIFETDGAIATLTLNRPARLNALNANALEESVQAIDIVSADDSLKALIITGAGKGFCAGWDIADPTSGADSHRPGLDRKHRLEPFVTWGRIVKRILACPKPVIAAVNGVAAGGGLSIALGCDIRIASEAARFSAIFIKRALLPDSGATHLMPRVLEMSRALELMWTGQIISAHEAERLRLVNRVVPSNELVPAVKELADKIARGPSMAIEIMKQIVYRGLETDHFEQHLAMEAWGQNLCIQTKDFQEGAAAFREKREPVFQGL